MSSSSSDSDDSSSSIGDYDAIHKIHNKFFVRMRKKATREYTRGYKHRRFKTLDAARKAVAVRNSKRTIRIAKRRMERDARRRRGGQRRRLRNASNFLKSSSGGGRRRRRRRMP